LSFDKYNQSTLNVKGEDYDGYRNCIVFISLYDEHKEMIAKRVFENEEGNNLIFLRAFVDEEYKSLGKGWKVIEQKSDFHTLVLGPH
jgi:hypothetical protein